MKRLAITALVLAFFPVAWITLLWHTTGKGHPFCLSEMSFPTEEALVRDGVRQHLEMRIRAKDVEDARIANPGPYAALPASAEDAEAFLRAFPHCCALEPLGSIQSDVDKVVNLLNNYDEIEVGVKDPTWVEPYITHGRRYTVSTCSLGMEK